MRRTRTASSWNARVVAAGTFVARRSASCSILGEHLAQLHAAEMDAHAHLAEKRCQHLPGRIGLIPRVRSLNPSKVSHAPPRCECDATYIELPLLRIARASGDALRMRTVRRSVRRERRLARSRTSPCDRRAWRRCGSGAARRSPSSSAYVLPPRRRAPMRPPGASHGPRARSHRRAAVSGRSRRICGAGARARTV